MGRFADASEAVADEAEAPEPVRVGRFRRAAMEAEAPGARMGLAATAVRAGAPIVGSILGTVIAPGAGTAIGGGTFGAIGEYVAEEIEEYAKLRTGKNFKRVGLETVMGAMPLLGRFPAIKTMMGRAMLRSSQSGAVSGIATMATELVETGELPSVKEVLFATGLGGLFGAAGGMIESKQLSRLAPMAAKELGRKFVPKVNGAQASTPVPGRPRIILDDEIDEIAEKATPAIGVAPAASPLPGVGERRFPKNLRGSGQIVDDVMSEIEADPQIRFYLKDTHKAELQRAADRINADYEGTRAWLLTHKPLVEEGKDFSATAQLMMVSLQKRGRYEDTIEIGKRVSELMTSGGQFIESAKLMKSLTPQSWVTWAVREADKRGLKLSKEETELILEHAKWVDGLADGREKDIGRVKLIQKIQDLTPSTRAEKFLEAWKAGLLSGVPTHVVNSVSNMTTILTRGLVERPLAAAIEGVVTLGGRTRERGVYFGESVDALVGMWQGAKEGMRRAFDAFVHESPLDTPIEEIRTRAIKGTLGQAIRIPFRALTAMDEFFKSVVYAGEIHRLAWRTAWTEGYRGHDLKLRLAELVRNPTSKMIEKAEFEKLYQVFQKPLGNLAQGGAAWVRKHPSLQVIVPFYTTPINIVKYGLERTPLNLLRTIYRGGISGTAKGAEISEDLAKGAIGLMAAAGVSAMAKEGLITGGGPTDHRARKIMMESGWQPYSIKIGNQYVSYARVEPFATILGLTADAIDMWDHLGKENTAKTLGFLLTRNITDKTMVRGLSDVINAIHDPERYGSLASNRFVGSVIPTGLKNVAQALDPTLRRPETIGQTLMARTPGLTEYVPPLRGIWGAPVVIQTTGPERAVSPFYRKEIVTDDATDEVIRVGRSTGWWTENPDRKLSGIELGQKTYDQYQEQAGAEAHRRIVNLVRTPEYKMADDEKKKGMLSRAFNESRDLVRDRMGITQQVKAKTLGLGPLR